MPREHGFRNKYPETYKQVYEMLIEAARNRELVFYGDVAKIMGIESTGQHMGTETGRVSSEICEEEVQEHGRPMLGAVLVKKGTRVPGDGFWDTAKRLGRWDGAATAREFWKKELEAVYRAWSD